MSSGLMSCVRENSPPLELDFKTTAGQISLHEYNTLPASTSSHHLLSKSKTAANVTQTMDDAVTLPNAEQQKKRRFHPLRNLRRIFRRRTINSTSDTTINTLTPQSSASEKNLRSATLTAIPKTVSASSPSSPLTQQQLHDAYTSQSLPKSKSCGNSSDKELRDALLNKHQKQKILKEKPSDKGKYTEMYTAASNHTTAAYHNNLHTPVHQRQSVGVAVFPSAMNRNFFNERQKLRSIGDSSQDLGSSDNDSGQISSSGQNNMPQSNGIALRNANGSASIGEMSDSQRSLSEGRLVDSDYAYEGLSQSHDSVFSESATASSLSIVLKAELTDVLRKRRNRPDVSDEDLGLPHSPASPQRRSDKVVRNSKLPSNSPHIRPTTTNAKTGNYSDVSSISLLSINSHNGDEFQATSTANNTVVEERKAISTHFTRSLTTSTISTSDILRIPPNLSLDETRDDIDFFSGDRQRLSHAAAKHKMAIRPTKKKVPSRLHRKTVEIGTSIPEGNEDILKVAINDLTNKTEQDTKTKTRSLPPGVNAKIFEEYEFSKTLTAATPIHAPELQKGAAKNLVAHTEVNQSKPLINVTSTTSPTGGLANRNESKAKAGSIGQDTEPSKTSKEDAHCVETTETGFLRRLMQRNSKRSIAKSGVDETVMEQSEPKKIQLSTSCIETRQSSAFNLPLKSKSSTTYEQSIEQTRQEIKREIVNEAKTGISAMLNSYLFSGGSDKATVSSKETSAVKPKSGPAARQRYMPKEICASNTFEKKECDKTSLKSYNEVFQSTSLVKEINQTSQQPNIGSLSSVKSDQHYEKKPKIVGLSAFQQKITRSNDSFVRTPSCNSMETSTDDPIDYYEEKQRRAVEKSRSFRVLTDDSNPNVVHSNMPSLPDLSLSFRVPSAYLGELIAGKEYSSPSPPDEHNKCVSLGFEINDNNLMKSTGSSMETIKTTPIASNTRPEKKLILNSAADKHVTATKMLAPVSVVQAISPVNSVNRNISEIEQNIDMIVKSSFVSVVQNQAPIVENSITVPEQTTSGDRAKKFDGAATPSLKKTEKERPKVLNFREKFFEDATMTPNTAAVPLRDKGKVLAVNQDKYAKMMERKSAPVAQVSTEQVKSPKRPASAVATTTEKVDANVPEFLKIQLNRVDPERIARGPSVVLAKNVKQDVQSPSINNDMDNESSLDTESSQSSSTCIMSINECPKKSESVEVQQAEKPSKRPNTFAMKYKQNEKASHETTHATSPTTPNSPVKCSVGKLGQSPTKSESINPGLPATPSEMFKGTSVKLSLQERKRIFLADENTKAERKTDYISNERKKSLPEELNTKETNKNEDHPKTPLSVHPTETAATESSIIVFRKKSLGTSSANNSNTSPTATNNTSNASENDGTPELMKVFARRSLKVKDEDIQALTDKVNNGNNTAATVSAIKKSLTTTSLTKLPNNQINIESDKENHSASDEKLDMLTKCDQDAIMPNNKNAAGIGNSTSHSMSNRNSVSDFRNNIIKFTGKNNNNYNSSTTTLSSTKISHLPPIKANGYRVINKESNGVTTTSSSCTTTSETQKPAAMKIEQNNNIDLHKSTRTSTPPMRMEKADNQDTRGSLPVVTQTNGSMGSKTIERSATVGEFKGIHQRRAEWEQRVKEAFK